MPELPEVEIVRQSLNKKIKYKKIRKIIIRNRNLRFKISPEFEKSLINKEIKKISRLSKYRNVYNGNESSRKRILRNP